jgi:hypothetical protein
MQYSKTRLIKDNRLTKISLDNLIEAMKNGYFDRTFEPLLTSKNIYSEKCRLKKCDGELRYDDSKKRFYCNTCFLVQKLQFIREEKTINDMAQIDYSTEYARNYNVKKLEEIHQLLRNLYRITVDDLPIPEPTEQQIQQAKELHKKIDGLLFSIRTSLSCGQNYDRIFSITKDDRLMTIEEIQEHIDSIRMKTMCVIDRISSQLSYKNILKLVIANIENEPKRNMNSQQNEEKTKEILEIIY